MPITLHHVAQTSPKASEAVDYYVSAWGLRETGRDGDSVRLAAALDSADGYSLVITPGAEKSVDHFCLVSADAADVAALHDTATANGVTVLDGEPGCAGLTDVFHFIDIDGRRVEVGVRPDDVPAADAVDDATPLKPGHIVLNTPDIVAATAWYEQKLGFGVRDWRADQMSFVFMNTDHHTIALNKAPHASLNHVAWEMQDINQFFRAVGRVDSDPRGDKLYGPGRHGPGDYIFCYFLDPTGFICEYETDGLKIDDPANYDFRIWEYSPVSSDQWMGSLSGGLPERFRTCAKGVPDPGWISPAVSKI